MVVRTFIYCFAGSSLNSVMSLYHTDHFRICHYDAQHVRAWHFIWEDGIRIGGYMYGEE